MAKELRAIGLTPGATTYYVNVIDSAGLYMVASTGATEAFNSSHWSTYAITTTENAGTGDFFADLPSGAAAGTYDYVYRQKSGGSPAVGDLSVSSPGTYNKTPSGVAGYPGGPVDSVVNDVGGSVVLASNGLDAVIVEPSVSGGTQLDLVQAISLIASRVGGDWSQSGAVAMFYAMGNPTVPRSTATIAETSVTNTVSP